MLHHEPYRCDNNAGVTVDAKSHPRRPRGPSAVQDACGTATEQVGEDHSGRSKDHSCEAVEWRLKLRTVSVS